MLADLIDWIFAVLRRSSEFNFDFKRTDFLENPQHLVKMWLTDKLCPSWPPGYVNSERFERVNNIEKFMFLIVFNFNSFNRNS